MLSVSSCRTSRPRLAPCDSRMAISRRRAVARASSRLPTLAQAISSTRPTTPSSSSEALTTAWRSCGLMAACGNGTRWKVRPRLSFVYSRSSRLAMAVISACAAGIVTPGRNRPMVLTNRPRRCSYQLSSGSRLIWRFIAIGTHSSGWTPVSVPVKRWGATPITVKPMPLSRRELPITAGSPPSCWRQKWFETTATGCAPGLVASSTVKKRPRSASTPSSSK